MKERPLTELRASRGGRSAAAAAEVISPVSCVAPSWALAHPDEGLRRLRSCRYSARVSARCCRLAGSLPFERPEDLLDGPKLLILVIALRSCLKPRRNRS
ncbi:hypothetical protein HPB47_009962 [Ixodes persulcatus]|uniref:Uncharacterized protein n=1 Tax=Ixodes persulcatus TaxID=34615 RepID=A0AC60P0K0_IXOPE|nr:hypothetical protein HPB47_009962 [Ixodes persulcatus]